MKMKCKICGKEMDSKPRRHITLNTPMCRFPNTPYSIVLCDDCIKTFVEAVAECGDIEFSTIAKRLVEEENNGS